MAYDITALPAFQTQGKALVIQAILEAQTIKLLTSAGSFDPTAKGDNTVQLMAANTVIQDGSTCGFNAIGGVALAQAILSIKPLKVNEVYCERELEKTWAVGQLQKGQTYDSLSFLTDITAIKTKDISAKVEDMIWKGDVTLTGDTTLSRMDGYLKKIKAGAYLALSGATSGATGVIAKLQAGHLAMPIVVRGQEDYRILIGKDVHDAYVAELASKNLFNPSADNTLFGTTAKFEVVNGLNGGHAVYTRMQNLTAGGEMTDIDFKSWFSEDDDNYKIKANFSLGATPIAINNIGYVKVA
jgi:hypothetical protein